MDNKFGKCCKCPARMDSMTQFTEYESANAIAQRDMKSLGFKSIYEYNDHIETNGVKLIKKNIKYQKDNHTCQSNKKNRFNIDSSDYHKRFDEMIHTVKQENVVPVDFNVITNVLSTEPKANYSARYINSDKPLFKMSRP